MNYPLAVRISVPVIGGYAIGTGYPVDQNLILTCRHVLFPEKGDSTRPIKVFWRRSGPAEGYEPIDLSDDAITWVGEGALDAALIKCSRPDTAIQGIGLLSGDSVQVHAKWSSTGFASAARIDGCHNSEPFAGTVNGSGDGYLSLSSTSHPNLVDDWGGVSGMPVFVDYRIAAIVIRGLRDLAPNALHAIPVQLLLKNPGFRERVRYDVREQRKSIARKKMIRIIKHAIDRDIAAFDVVADKIPMMAAWRSGIDAKRAAEALADRLLEMQLDEVLKVLRQAQKAALDEQDDSVSAPDALAVLLITQCVVPALYEDDAVEQTRGQCLSGDVTPVQMPVHLGMVAEIIMAGVDGRETRFRPAPDEKTFPEGLASLPHAPENGSGDVKAAAKDLLTHLGAKFVPEHSKALRDALFLYLTDSLYGSDRGESNPGEDHLKAMIRDRMKNDKDDGGPSLYLLFRLPSSDDYKSVMLETIKAIREEFDNITCLVLRDDHDIGVRERNRFDQFRRMLWDKERHKP